MKIKDKDIKRFEYNIHKLLGNIDTCWLWVGYKIPQGYGRIMIDGERWLAHRLSYIIYKGNIPNHFDVCHKCDNTLCVNPDHLFLGTHKENMRDMVTKGRCKSGIKNKGEKHGMSKLIDSDIPDIIEMTKTMKLKDVAKIYKVGISTISRIKNRTHWKHIC